MSTTNPKRPRTRWPAVIDRARAIVEAHDGAMTVRQVFYRLVAEARLPNDLSAYNRLCRLTAAERRAGTFPALVDDTRMTLAPLTFDGPDDARVWVRNHYRRNRLADQDVQVILGVEKGALATLVDGWFRDRYGFPVVVLRGYASQPYIDDVAALIADDPRPAHVIYAGDFDPSGEDIERDLRERAGIDTLTRVAVTPETIDRFNLPEQMGKRTDPRGAAFALRHGRLVQVEVEAVVNADLRALFAAAIAPLIDEALVDAAIARERDERTRL